MPSHKSVANRENAIVKLIAKYPSIHKLSPAMQDSWINDYIYEVCEEFSVNRKTAIEYFKVACIRQRRLQSLLSFEETRVLDEAINNENSETKGDDLRETDS